LLGSRRARINATGRSTAELLAGGDGSLIYVTSGGISLLCCR